MAYIDKINTVEDLKRNSEKVLNELKATIDGLDLKKAEVLLYWLDTWGRKYLGQEDSFDYEALINYPRGSIIQAHLGFKVGSEQGGLHYALIVENDNAPLNRTVMAIPLRSLKKEESPTDIDERHEVFLGFDLFKAELEKLNQKLKQKEELKASLLRKGKDDPALTKTIKELKKKITNYSKGSVAIVNQMCAVSKIRIYCPKYPGDELTSTSLSNEKLDEIDRKIIQLFTKQTTKKVLTT